MAQTVRIILYTSNEAAAPELRRAITSLPRLRIVAELDEPSLLGHAVAQFPCDLIVADLDPNALVVIECCKQLKEAHPSLPVFAVSGQTEGDVVLRALKAGIREYLVRPLNIQELQEAIERAIGAQSKTKEPGKLISVMGSAGGVGCTTIATNLAVELAELVGDSRKVALVDLDFRFGHVATLLDVHGQYTVADLCSTPEQLDEQMILKALIKHESGLLVLRRPHSFAQAELISAAHCANVLTSLQEMCAYVVVDGPTRHDPGARAVLDAADINFMILQLLVPSVRNADRIVQELAAQGFNTERIQFVCNRLGRDSAHLDVSQVETILNRKVFMTIMDDWKAVSSAINIGQPLKVEFGRTRVRQELLTLAMKIHCPEKLAEKDGRRGGLLGKFLRKGGGEAAPQKTEHQAPVPNAG
ncbi:MAG TPA: response regulator [Phycisphaerae bacterium]|nr:response regulator [Phycisphaerae bacterium]